jgi:hypothetical protein
VNNTPVSYSGGPRLKFGPGTGYPDRVFVVSLRPPGNAVKVLAMTASFYILSNSLFTYHPFIRYIVRVTEKR